MNKKIFLEGDNDHSILSRSSNVAVNTNLMNRSHEVTLNSRNSVCVMGRREQEDASIEEKKARLPTKRDSIKTKKYDHYEMPMQLKPLRIETETGIESERHKIP